MLTEFSRTIARYESLLKFTCICVHRSLDLKIIRDSSVVFSISDNENLFNFVVSSYLRKIWFGSNVN